MSIRDYKITDEQFNEKGMTSLPDTLKGTPYENKRSLEKFTREVVAPNFNAIVEDFAQMEESANNWSAEEAQRVKNENARQTAEHGRVSMEGQRETNETARLLAEENRISAENDRVTAETARVNAENKRDSAEKSRVSAETARNVWQTYDAAKTYVPGNKVSFGGSSYVCTAATFGHEPTDAAYWLLIAQKGEDGAGADDLRQINNALDAIDPTKITAKAAPADGDGVMIADSADGGKAKRLLWSSVKAALGKLFVPLARKVNGKALSADVTLTGENIAVSTTDSTPISGAVKYRTNPNLLDNWFFGRPVNQRNGYYVLSGKPYYLEYPTVSGYTSAPVKATPQGSYYNIVIDGVTYAVNASDVVPGYCAGGVYTVDRWKQGFDGTLTLTLTNDGIKIAAGNDGTYKNFEQVLPDVLTDTTYTMSFLVDDFTSIVQIYTGFSTSQFDIRDNLISWTFKTGSSISGVKTIGIQTRIGKTVTIKAAKLELGAQQTLAHKENGVWVLNEIPDFGEQLRRCQRYYFVTNANHFFSGWCTTTEKLWTHIPTPVPMRAIPAISVIKPGNIIFGTSGANVATSANQYEIENADATGIKMAVNIAGLTLGAGMLCDGKFAFSVDL